MDFAESDDHVCHSGRLEPGFLMLEYPPGKALAYDIGWHRGFQGRIADEKDHGKECVARQFEATHECSDVEVVLMEGILESVFLSVNLLRPLALIFRTEDPATVIFRFDNEDAEWGNDDMVKLGSSLSVRAREVEVVEGVVLRGIKPSQAFGYCVFSEPALETARAEKFRKNKKNEEAKKPRQVREEWLEDLCEVDL